MSWWKKRQHSRLGRPGTTSALLEGIVNRIRTKTATFALIASFLALTAMPVVATSTHEVCTAMRHDCNSNEVLSRCCCGDRSDAHPSPVPLDRAHAVPDSVQGLDFVGLVFDMGLTITPLVHPMPALSRPPDLPILFDDLRI